MSKRFLISVAAIALMAGAGAANAQGMKNEGGGAAMQQTAPSAGGGAGAAPTQKSESAGPGKAGTHDMKSGQTEKSPGAMKNQRAEDNMKGGKDTKAEGREGRDTNMKAEGREGRDNNMKAEGREGRDNNMKAEGREGRDNNMKAEGREGRDNNMKAEGREGNKAAETKSTTEKSQTTGQAGAAAKLSTEQRTKITTLSRNQRVQSVNNVNFSISVGTRVPREGVHFYPLPAEVVTIYPEWRGYQFILVRDEILVIDPNTYEIVAVLNA
jgi:Protein of unknown function (DUF1236)